MIKKFSAFTVALLLVLSAIGYGCGDSGSTSNPQGDEDWQWTDIEQNDAPDYDPNAPGLIQTTPPDEIDFGAVQIFAEAERELIIRNVGQGLLTVNTIFVNGTSEFWVENAQTPFEIYPGGMRQILVKYKPQDPGPDQATLQIVSNAAQDDSIGSAPLKNITLKSQYKGTSKLVFFRPCTENDTGCLGDWRRIEPNDQGEYVYGIGNTPAGSSIDGTIKVCNLPDEPYDNNKAIKITSITKGRSTNATQAAFDLSLDTADPTPQSPLYLVPGSTPNDAGSCVTVYITYSPYEPTFPPETHYTHIRIEHDADIPQEDVIEVRVEGTASESALIVMPNPIDFGEVEFNQTATVPVSIQNPTANQVTISNIDIQGNTTSGGVGFGWEFQGTETFPIVLDSLGELVINATFSPVRAGVVTDYLRIFTNIPGAETIKVRMEGLGKEPNLPPVARIAITDHGPDVTFPVVTETCSGINCPTITFFGDISYDPDRTDWTHNGIVHYYWSFEKPDGSSVKLWCACSAEHNAPPDCRTGYLEDLGDCNAPLTSITTGIDLPGEYKVTLIVEDADGAQSYPKVVYVRTYGMTDIITVQLDFDCDGFGCGDSPMDVDLQWIAPNGVVCDMRHMNSQRTCDFGTYGYPVVSEYTQGCRAGHTEAITHENAPDGTYRIRAFFAEDCCIDSPLGIPIINCLNPESTDVTIKIYINGEVRWTRTGHLGNKGDVIEWTIEKAGGTFREPQP